MPVQPLESLIGDWVSESQTPDGKKVVPTITYQWMFDRRFVQAECERSVDGTSLQMLLVYLWDALTRKVRAWVVASDGSWNQADVTFVEGAVRLDTKGASADGTTVSLISTLRSTDNLV